MSARGMDKTHLLYLQNRVAYARDQAAYKKLYFHFYPSVYKLACIIVRHETLVEEIVSDVMIRLWTMENRLAYVEHLKSYLLTATKNTALTYLKKIREEQPICSDDSHEHSSLSDMPDQQLITLELSKIIELTVRALPQKCQLAYRLIKEEGLSYKEACQILQVSQKTLEAHICVALKKIRQILDSYLLEKKS
ncbi:MAG: sigma-70 family RNA polymerase sigma factor [Niabella sp.]